MQSANKDKHWLVWSRVQRVLVFRWFILIWTLSSSFESFMVASNCRNDKNQCECECRANTYFKRCEKCCFYLSCCLISLVHSNNLTYSHFLHMHFPLDAGSFFFFAFLFLVVKFVNKKIAHKWQMSFDDDFDAIDKDETHCSSFSYLHPSYQTFFRLSHFFAPFSSRRLT